MTDRTRADEGLRLLLVGDCEALLEAALVQGSRSDISIERLTSPVEAVALLDQGRSFAEFDAIIIDPAFQEADAFDGIRALRQALPSMPVIVVADSLPRHRVVDARRLGVAGFITRKLRVSGLMRAIRLAIVSTNYLMSRQF